nr:hypothetical protein KXZ65_10780 [Pectobacterium sp. PL152]
MKPERGDIHVASIPIFFPTGGYRTCAPALAVVAVCFITPLGLSVGGAFVSQNGVGVDNFVTALTLYLPDILFTLLIVSLSTLLIGLLSVTIGGYLTLGKARAWWRCCAGSIAGRCLFRLS